MATVDSTDLVTAMWAPGAVTAHTLPTYFPDIGQLVGAVLWDVASATSVSTTALTVIEYGGTPGTGEIVNDDGNNLTTGDAAVADELLVITYRAA